MVDMDSRAFSTTTRALLKKAGWYDKRVIDTGVYEDTLRKRRYPVHECVLQFLREFGGLTVIHPHKHFPNEEDRFHLNASKAANSIDFSRVKSYSARIGTPLCVIGQAYREYMVLLMDSNERIYAGYDGLLIKVGDSAVEAIEALCTGASFSKIP